MSSKKRTASQVAKDKAALKKLRASGYRGKIDLRKAPTKYQLQKIKSLRGKRKPAAKKSAPKGRRVIREKDLANLKQPHTLKTYALPFLRKGREQPEWRRFTYRGLKKFLAEYKAGQEDEAAEWQSFAVEEDWNFSSAKEASAFRQETNVYFSGVRIVEPKGGVTQKRKPNKKPHRGRKRR